MARIETIHMRLLEWQRWRLSSGGGVLGYAAVDLQGAQDGVRQRDPYQQAPVPTSAVQAGETDQAVQGLPSDLRATVCEYYLGRGGEADHLRRLVCSRATLHARLERADHLLATHFSARAERAQRERERVELLQRSAGSFTS
jgi:hypothetical protein